MTLHGCIACKDTGTVIYVDHRGIRIFERCTSCSIDRNTGAKGDNNVD